MVDKQAGSLMGSVYLDRYAWQEELFPDFAPSENLSLIVVIPCFKEPNLIDALEALNQCIPPYGDVLIIVLVNEPANASIEIKTTNQSTLNELKKFRSKYSLLVSHQVLPDKKAGVGLARKIGMDEAVRIFRRAGNDGAIICFDADCQCDTNYLDEIELAYSKEEVQSGIVFYEHLLHRQHHAQIVNYELYLRYYIDSLRYAGFPFAHQTLGSCITVRASMYEKVGGMNTRKAGEDFYFLNKTIPQGGFIEINSTTIRPSDRVSDRVPFGTGKAINDLIASTDDYHVYHPNSFEDLKLFFSKCDQFWDDPTTNIPMSVKTFLGDEWMDQITDLKNKVSSKEQFNKRFYHWFDAFRILKFIHFSRDHFYQNVTLEEALDWLRQKHHFLKGSKESYLIQLRYLDRNH